MKTKTQKLAVLLCAAAFLTTLLAACAGNQHKALRQSPWYAQHQAWIEQAIEEGDGKPSHCAFGYNRGVWVADIVDVHHADLADGGVAKPIHIKDPVALKTECKLGDNMPSVFYFFGAEQFPKGLPVVGQRWAFAASANAKGLWSIKEAILLPDGETASR